MTKREQALTQLNLLRHADNLSVRSAAETVVWLDERLKDRSMTAKQFCQIVLQQHRLIKSIDTPVCQVCADLLECLLETESSYENI